MKYPLRHAVSFAFLSLAGTVLILYSNPRFDWRSVCFLFLLALGEGFLLYFFLQREKDKLKATISELTNLLHSSKEWERLWTKEDLFGGLRDEIRKGLMAQSRARDRALKAKEELKRNLEDVTHQIKTPLTGILLLLELWETDIANAPGYQGKIRKEIERIYRLSDSLLKLSAMEARAIALKMAYFSAMGLVTDVEIGLEQIIAAKEIKIQVEGKDFLIWGDRVWLMEALLNIIKNAVEVSPYGGSITVHLEQNKVFQSIIIIDKGPGLSVEQQKHLFQRFYKSNPQAAGFGIGLPLAKSILRQHGGELLVRSSPAGSTFEMRFYPAANEKDGQN